MHCVAMKEHKSPTQCAERGLNRSVDFTHECVQSVLFSIYEYIHCERLFLHFSYKYDLNT